MVRKSMLEKFQSLCLSYGGTISVEGQGIFRCTVGNKRLFYELEKILDSDEDILGEKKENLILTVDEYRFNKIHEFQTVIYLADCQLIEDYGIILPKPEDAEIKEYLETHDFLGESYECSIEKGKDQVYIYCNTPPNELGEYKESLFADMKRDVKSLLKRYNEGDFNA